MRIQPFAGRPFGARGSRGFTLIEIMIVVAIIGILAAVAVPRFSELIRKSREGATKGALGAVRSALVIYYSDNEGKYPLGTPGDSVTFLQAAMTTSGKYLQTWPAVNTSGWHNQSSRVDAISGPELAGDDGGWVYSSDDTSAFWGSIWVECTHTDSKGGIWTAY